MDRKQLHSFIIFALLILNATCDGEKEPIKCLNQKSNLKGCPKILNPVCACIVSGKEQILQTFDNSCLACQNDKAVSYTIGSCKLEENEKPDIKPSESLKCLISDKTVRGCDKIYNPVCATLYNGKQKKFIQYNNPCVACLNSKVLSYRFGLCNEKEEDKPIVDHVPELNYGVCKSKYEKEKKEINTSPVCGINLNKKGKLIDSLLGANEYSVCSQKGIDAFYIGYCNSDQIKLLISKLEKVKPNKKHNQKGNNYVKNINGESFDGESDDGESYDGEIYGGESYDGEHIDGEGNDGESNNGETYDGESYDGEIYGGESYDGESYDGESYDGESYDGEGNDGESNDGESFKEENYDGEE